MQDFADKGRAADKIVYSKTLATPSSARTRIERFFDPDAIRQLKGAAERDITVGGSTLAALATKAGLVDECHLFVMPVMVGGGNQSLPSNVRLKLELLDERRFGNGVVHLHYRVRGCGEGDAALLSLRSPLSGNVRSRRIGTAGQARLRPGQQR